MKNEEQPKWKWWKRTWCLDSSYRENLLLWKVLNRAVHTRAKLVCMGMVVDIACLFCSEQVETVEHLFFECNYIKQLWYAVLNKQNINMCSTDNCVQWEIIFEKSGNKGNKKRLFTVLLKRFIHTVWKERNSRVFQPSRVKSDGDFKMLMMNEMKLTMRMQSFDIEPGILSSFNLL